VRRRGNDWQKGGGATPRRSVRIIVPARERHADHRHRDQPLAMLRYRLYNAILQGQFRDSVV
jgi:hypothetical protein